MIREKPYQWRQGVAWLSLARVVKRVVKTFNGRNPYLHLLKKNKNKWFFDKMQGKFD